MSYPGWAQALQPLWGLGGAGSRGCGPGLSLLPPLRPGKQMIETYFDFRLYRLWKSRQHSKLLDFDDVL